MLPIGLDLKLGDVFEFKNGINPTVVMSAKDLKLDDVLSKRKDSSAINVEWKSSKGVEINLHAKADVSPGNRGNGRSR